MHWKNTFGSLMTIISLLGTFENGTILLVFYMYPILRTPSNKILISMSVADFFTGSIVAPLYVVSLFDERLVGDCRLFVARRYFATVFMGASAFSVGFVSLDRASLLINLQNYEMSNEKLYISLLMCWIVPLLVPLVGMISDKKFSTAIIILYILVVLAVSISYAALIMSMRKHRRTLNNEMTAIFINTERKAVKTVLVIISSHFIMIFPMLIVELLYSAGYFDNRDILERPKGAILTTLLCTGNSIINPAIYCNRISTLRDHVLKLFGLQKDDHIKSASLETHKADQKNSVI